MKTYPAVAMGLLAVALWLAPPAHAQYSAIQGISIVTSSRSQALGEATVALRGYPGAAQLNPATLGLDGSVQSMSTFDPGSPFALRTPWLRRGELPLDEAWVAGPSIEVRRGRWAGGYQYREFSVRSAEIRDVQGNPMGQMRIFSNSHKLAAAHSVTPSFSVGAGVGVAQEHGAPGDFSERGDADQDLRSLVVDLGGQYQRSVEWGGVTVTPAVGWSLTDFGSNLRYSHQFENAVPTIMRGGAALQLASKPVLRNRPAVRLGLFGALSKEMVRQRIDTSGALPRLVFDSPFKALLTAWEPLRFNTGSVEDPEIHTVGVWGQLRRHLGAELSLAQVASVRLGRFHEPDFIGARQYTTVGFGLDVYFVALDHSRVISNHFAFRDMSYWTLTARLPLGRSEDNFWPELLRKLKQ